MATRNSNEKTSNNKIVKNWLGIHKMLMQCVIDVDTNGIMLIKTIRANDKETLELMIDEGVNINLKNTNGRTALMEASIIGNLEIETGADPNIAHKDGTTPLILATKLRWSRGNCLRILLNAGADPDIRDHQGQTARDLYEEDKEEFDYMAGKFAGRD